MATKDFSQYLAEARAKYGTAAPQPAKPLDFSKFKPGTGGRPQDPLSWFVDILSRPMRTVQNVPNQILDEELKRKQAKATGQPYNEIGGAINVLTAPIRGFFSTNPADQPTGAQLIEKEYDVRNYGRLGYVDKPDNVSNFEKGAGGLALDIGLDPLTWIPGAQLIKGGQLAARGARGIATGADALVAGTGVGRALGAETRIANRAARAEETRINKLRNNAFEQAQRDAEQRVALAGSAFAPTRQTPSGYFSQQANLDRLTSPVMREAYTAPTIGARVPLSPVTAPSTARQVSASQKLVQALRAENVPTPAGAIPEGEVLDSAALMDAVGPARGSTVAEQFNATGAVPQIMAQLDLIQPKTITAVTEPAQKVANSSAELATLRAQETRLVNQLPTSATAEARRESRLADVRAQIKAIEKGLKTANPKRAAEVTTSFSASAVLKDLLADPVAAKELTDTLGSNVVQKLSEAKNTNQLTSAVNYLAKVVRGDEVKSATKFQNDLAEELRREYDIKVPDTAAPAISGTSSVGTERAAEAAVAHEAGENLRDVPWLGGYSQEQIDLVSELLPKYLLNDFLNTKGYTYITGRGALSTSDFAGEGLHKFANEFNQMDQYSMAEALIAKARKEISEWNRQAKKANPAAMLAGNQRAARLKEETLKLTDLSFRWLDDKGVSVWMGINESRIRLYLHQMIDVLNETARSSSKLRYDALDVALFNTATSVPLTNIMDAVVALYRTPDMTDEAVEALLKKAIPGANNFLLQNKPQRWKHYLPGTAPKGMKLERNIEDGVYKGDYGLIEPNQFAKDMVVMLRESAPDMQKVVLHNEEMALARAIADQRDLSKAVIDDLFEAANDPALFGEQIRKIANIPVMVGEKGASNWVMPRVSPIIAKPATDYWPNDVMHDAQLIQRLVKAGTDNNREALTKAVMDNGAYMAKSAEEIVKLRGSMFDGVGPDGRVINEAWFDDAVNEQALNDILEAGRVSTVNKLFGYSKGKEQVIHPYNQAQVQLSKGIADFKLNINKVAKNHPQIYAEGTTVIQQAFREIASGVTSGPATAAARADLEPIIWSVFGKAGDPEAMGIWQRAGASLEDIEVYMRKNKLDFTIDMAAAEKKIGSGVNVVEAALDDWKLWIDDIDNPLKFLSDMYFAGSMLHMDKSFAALAVARGGFTSAKPKAGYVKLPELNLFEHPLMGHMPKNTYIREDILQEVNNLEKMLMSDYSPKSEVGKWISERYIPTLGAWKKGVTIYRLGHHVRNFVSSEGIQWTVEGNRYYMSSGTDAMRVLMTHKNYDGVDWSQKLESLVRKDGRLEMPTGKTKLFSFGKNDVTVDSLYEAADKHGLFSDYRMIEDLFADGAENSFVKVINKVSFKDTALERAAGGLSEYQQHYARLHHFAQILRKEAAKSGGKNWDDVVEKAAIKVRRHHPDGLTLTPFEQQVMKPLIPFYSWFRQILPVILEGIAQHPGRFMVYPKASYNLAIAMGVNPESLQDPFPADQLFPEFVTDQLTGPVSQIDGNYFKANPGYAYADFLNQFVANPQQGLMGMVTPFVKVPGELITGTRWDTGISIKDYSDYVDAQLPGINYLSNFTGISTSGSLASLLAGYGIDSQYAVDKGNKTPLDQGLSVSNWFTGLGLQNISKENYKNLAEIEKRNRAAEEAKRQSGEARSPF